MMMQPFLNILWKKKRFTYLHLSCQIEYIEFNLVRVQVLGKEEVPSLNEIIAIIHGEEM